MTPARVLAIDDEPALRKLIARALSADNEVTTSASAEEALQLLGEGKAFDVIICDLMMPTMSGIEFLEEVQRRGVVDSGRIIFLTGGAFSEATREFLRRTSNPTAQKPFNASELRALVARHAVKMARESKADCR